MYRGSIFVHRQPASIQSREWQAQREGERIEWESTGSDISLVLLRGGGGNGGVDVTVLELGQTYHHHCTCVKKGNLQSTCTLRSIGSNEIDT
jgi:hypothetical protein